MDKPVENRLLQDLPKKEARAILDSCQRVTLDYGSVLYEKNHCIDHAYFPLTSIIAIISAQEHHEPLEISMIGNEGILGISLLTDVEYAPEKAVVLRSGSALQIPVMALYEIIDTCPSLRMTLKKYLYVLVLQMTQSIICTHFHEVGQRLARWLLMTHDRSHADHFHLTHQQLANMLGVQRSAISIAASSLQSGHVISYTRGEISIIDRRELEKKSCQCYQSSRKDYARILEHPR